MKPDLFEQDLAAIPDRLEALADRLGASDPWAGVVSAAPLVTGMGSSAYAGRTTAGWLRAADIDAIDELATTDPGWHGGSGTSAILVSASGASAETLDRSARLADGTRRIALVNNPESALARAADVVVEMAAGPEAGEVACRTYRHTLALLLALSDRSRASAACRDAASVTRSLLSDDAWVALADEVLAPAETTYWIAPESRIGSAMQSALMMREGPRRPAVGCETGDWSHVDVYLTLTTDYRCVVFTGSSWDEQAAEWLRKRGSHVVSVGEPLGVAGEVHLPLGGARRDGGLDPWARMLVEPLLAEMLALRWWRRDPVVVP